MNSAADAAAGCTQLLVLALIHVQTPNLQSNNICIKIITRSINHKSVESSPFDLTSNHNYL